ncbi:hypothetical protein GQ600_20559 [Phytophthora cactorum]|nr:hypothetical protein GQ600_20559 [Phytophthora cactorum]
MVLTGVLYLCIAVSFVQVQWHYRLRLYRRACGRLHGHLLFLDGEATSSCSKFTLFSHVWSLLVSIQFCLGDVHCFDRWTSLWCRVSCCSERWAILFLATFCESGDSHAADVEGKSSMRLKKKAVD